MAKCQRLLHQRIFFAVFFSSMFWAVLGGLHVQADLQYTDKLKVSGWEIADPPHMFGPRNLFEYINGAADFFIAYGFNSLEGAYYYSETDINNSVSIDIYDMGEKLNAFGVFQSKRTSGAETLNIGTASFGGEGYIAFFKDRYFVEVNSFIKNDQWKTQPLIMARQLAELLPGDTSYPQELSCFTGQGKIEGSEKYVKGGILGHAFLDKGIICNYRVEGETVSVFLAFFSSKEAAEKALTQHKRFLLESGTVSPLTGLDERAIVSQEPYHKNILLAQSGSCIIGMYDLSIPEKGESTFKRLLEHLADQCPDL